MLTIKDNTWPFDAGNSLNHSAILGTGADSTYVIDRRLLDSISLHSSQSVLLVDGSSHSIQSSGTLVGHPSIRTDLAPIFTQYQISVSLILANEAIGIIQDDKMVQLNSHPYF